MATDKELLVKIADTLGRIEASCLRAEARALAPTDDANVSDQRRGLTALNVTIPPHISEPDDPPIDGGYRGLPDFTKDSPGAVEVRAGVVRVDGVEFREAPGLAAKRRGRGKRG